MAQRDVEALRRRAADLIERSPAAAEVIRFYVAAVADGTLDGAPEPVRAASEALDPDMIGLFTRLAIRREQYSAKGRGARCPQCSALPQLGVLRPEGHGSALSLVCSVCLTEWPHTRDTCPCCATTGALAFYTAPELPNLQVQACDSCKRYLHLVDLGKDPSAIPELDELAALPLDVWAREQGYSKIQPNLAGI